ncbi:hypothetical protein KI387_040710, partial [Taxus chinensis]
MRVCVSEQSQNNAFWETKPYPETALFGSGHCSSPGSGYNSGHNSMGGDMVGQPFWQQSRGSREYSPVPSLRMTSGPSSRVLSGAVTPLHPRAVGVGPESPTSWLEEGQHTGRHFPLPPLSISNSSPFAASGSASSSSSAVPRSPGRADNPPSPGSRWKKGKLLGRGTFGHVYAGLNNETGKMCAMKEVTMLSDDPKSKESVKQLVQEIALLSRLSHKNIVQYYGSEMIADKLYIYLEYVSGGSIHKLLQEFGKFDEPIIRSYSRQILAGLAYLHNKNTVHRDIKGANILVDPNGQVKVADFGMAKHITAQSCPLSFKGSPYWMAPEVIKNSNGYNLAVDIWSLGCTVLEMATAKPPWSQYEGIAAMFKIGNSKELPTIPDYLSEEGKDFLRLCLQRNPTNRPSAEHLLEHPFVKYAEPYVKLDIATQYSEVLPSTNNADRPMPQFSNPLSLTASLAMFFIGSKSKFACGVLAKSKSLEYRTSSLACHILLSDWCGALLNICNCNVFGVYVLQMHAWPLHDTACLVKIPAGVRLGLIRFAKLRYRGCPGYGLPCLGLAGYVSKMYPQHFRTCTCIGYVSDLFGGLSALPGGGCQGVSIETQRAFVGSCEVSNLKLPSTTCLMWNVLVCGRLVAFKEGLFEQRRDILQLRDVQRQSIRPKHPGQV